MWDGHRFRYFWILFQKSCDIFGFYSEKVDINLDFIPKKLYF
jgi:hypothetical protein